MRRGQRLALVVALAASLVLVTATGAFTSVEADRGVNVAVVSDENAYLGLDARVAGCGNHARYRVTNRFGTAIDVTASVVDASANLSGVVTNAPTDLAPGDSGTIDVRVTPTGNTTPAGWVTLDITATGSEVRAELTRTVPTACLPTSGTGNEGGGDDGEDGESGGEPKDVSFVALCADAPDDSKTFSASGGPTEVTWSGDTAAVDVLVYKAGQSVYAIRSPGTTFESGDGTKIGTVGGPDGSDAGFASDPCAYAESAPYELVKFEYENGAFTAVYES